jgi:SAM-dependent methyltransferase
VRVHHGQERSVLQVHELRHDERLRVIRIQKAEDSVRRGFRPGIRGAGVSRPFRLRGCRVLYHSRMPRRPLTAILATLLLSAITLSAAPQLGSRPVDEWIKTLDGPQRIAALKIDEVVAAMKLQPGQRVADIGAGTGLFEVQLARGVGPNGRVYAEDIDAGFFPTIRKRAADAEVGNVETVLGIFTDPRLPVKNIDVALFHDVMHHIEKRAEYINTLAGYLAPSGRIVVVDYEPGKGPHREQPQLEVSREQLATWMRDAGLAQVDDVKLFPEKYFLVFARR